MAETSPFDDIRPYRDEETAGVLQRVIADNEFVDLLGDVRMPAAYPNLHALMRPFMRQWLLRRIRSMKTIADVQLAVEQYVSRVIERSMEGFSVHGLASLTLHEPHLFIGNHRDIALDPTLTNYALHHNGGDTARIAVGDNLFLKPFVGDLMRLNKGFIVRRRIARPRELLQALGTLSKYIWHSLQVDRENVWIAQREGRAKDGFDRTEPAIIKMFTLAKPKEVALSDYINQLGIVPVSISYEYDPCDARKARELRLLSETRSYEKAEGEDLSSIGLGITGNKGRVDLVFGPQLQTNAETPEAVARELDTQIVRNYRLHGTNALAYVQLFGDEAWQKASAALEASEPGNPVPVPGHGQPAEFAARIEAMPAEDRNMALHMYANPVLHKLYFIDASAHPLPSAAVPE